MSEQRRGAQERGPVGDLLSRLAARAVGRGPSAQPYVPVRFEPGGIEVVDEERVGPRGPAGPAQARVLAPVRPPGLGAMPTTTPEPARHSPVRARPVDRTEPAASLPALAPPPRPASTASPAPGGADDRRPAPTAVVDSGPRPHPSLAPVPARPVPTSPFTPPSSTHRDPPAATGAATEAPTVRVHIGRLEVRANLTRVPPTPARAVAPPAAELSLSDYLRGERDAT